MSKQATNPEQFAIRIKELPTIPTIIADVLRVVNDDNTTSIDLENLISRDQTLAGKILRLTNSAVYGLRRRIETIHESVVMLGRRTMKDIAVSMASSQLFRVDSTGLISADNLWGHAMATSLWARKIISFKRYLSIDSVVTAALLHDIGIVILYQYTPKLYLEIMEEAKSKDLFFVDLERERLRTTHARVGGLICAKWDLPANLTQLVAQHHNCAPATDNALQTLNLADYLASKYTIKPLDWEKDPVYPETLLESMEITDDDFEEILEAKDKIQETTESFSSTLV